MARNEDNIYKEISMKKFQKSIEIRELIEKSQVNTNNTSENIIIKQT